MRIKLKDTSLFFDVNGAKLVPRAAEMVERPTIVLLHGGPGYDHSHYKPGFDRYTEFAQLVYLDHRGQGRSDPDSRSNWRLDVWADDVVAFCGALGIDRPIILGSSFGGFVALALAARHPEFMSSMILLGTAASVDIGRIVERFGELGGEEAAASAAAMLDAPDSPENLAAYQAHCFPLYTVRPFDPAMLERCVFRPELVEHFFRPGGEYRRFDYHRALANVAVPTLMVHGRRDPIVPYDLAEATARSFPPGTVEFHLLEDCGHDVAFDAPDVLTSLIEDFVGR